MKSRNYGFQSGEEGKGAIGCIIAIVLMVIVIFLGFQLGPVYFNYYEFKSDLKQEVSRVAARAINDEDIVKNLIKIAEKNNIFITKENIKIRRIAGQIAIEVEYQVPVGFIIMTRDLNFKLEGSSFTAG
ncbi:MAG: DUF4845 domain-containing protein [Acidobacteriota bacterium]|jgi:hypothetical protein|nr:DUF4845 domain-containing protein [Acidobacteriota bacterium]